MLFAEKPHKFQQLWRRQYVLDPNGLDHGTIWRQQVGNEHEMIFLTEKDEDKDMSDKGFNERNKRWSIFQNIFTNGGRVYNRQKVSFGKNYLI